MLLNNHQNLSPCKIHRSVDKLSLCLLLNRLHHSSEAPLHEALTPIIAILTLLPTMMLPTSASPPAHATARAQKTIGQEIDSLRKVQATTPIHEIGCVRW